MTGIVGETINTAEVNTAIGGSAQATTVPATDATMGPTTLGFGLVVSTTAPATPPTPLPITVTVFPKSTPIPQSLGGLATQLQQAINNALAVQMPGASVQCSVTQTVAGAAWPPANWAIRVNAMLPQQPDAVLIFTAPDPTHTGLGDAATALGLATSPPPPATATSTPASTNVAHYALGTGQSDLRRAELRGPGQLGPGQARYRAAD